MDIKEALFKQCELFVNKRLQTVDDIISSNQKALQSETKSSAGDKHETGRAMLQLEMEKAGQQLAGINQMKEILAKIDVSKVSNVAHLGSVIETTSANYFLSISAGQIIVDGKVYFAISVSSPIGKLLLGKKTNDQLVFNNKKSIIKSIS
ncbi:GreA/GreB family elongation factor [Polaribacter butkevichii]|uniref:3-oxoacyl-ACP synthase n=1 Tax=Polaribacter butkevichii TaxID=218490 RepID=A0A2P6C780_9FLAO|nr:3-oxoacyl-ACP synthase [Polaribacter butkevichii]PQJ68787.1 3-oxoacyl-ACP synthase [Polaribacter butkevichii]